jgi:peroxiredoxin Q/BCP
MASQIKIGSKIPSFSIHDFDGIELESEDLIGSPFVLYFYPKDDTPGCTLEACSFRDSMDLFDNLETTVLGVSGDNPESHHNFIRKHNLNFTLLCDENLDLAKKFGAIQEKETNGKIVTGILRSTFVIDSNGIIRWIEQPVNVEGHAERVLEAVKTISE